MGVMGFTGERAKSGGGRRQRRAGGLPAAAPERLEGRLLFSGSAIESATVKIVWKGQTVQAVHDQWIVSTTNTAYFEKLAAQQGFTGVTSLSAGFYQFTSTDSAAQIARLAAAHPVAFGTAQPNGVVTAQNTLPDDAELVQQWGLNNTGQLESYDYNNNGIVTPFNEQTYPGGIPGGTPSDFPVANGNPDENQVGTVGTDIDAQQAWDVTTGSKAVVVAVLDTGIDLTHPDLVGNIYSVPGETAGDGVDNDGDGYVDDVNGWNFIANDNDVTDDNGHGTNVAGIIGASGNNGIGVSGVNWNVSILPVKVLDATGTGTDASIIAGINYVIDLKDHGSNIVVMNESLGESEFPTDVLMSEATRRAGQAGILSVVAAGNDSANLDRTVSSPASLSGSLSNVITVAAVDNQGKLAPFSNYGAQLVDIAAPGVNIYSTFPTYDFEELDEQSVSDGTTPSYYLPPPVSENYGFESGTSQATPFVTGTIALEAAANPSATPAQLKAALLESRTYDANLASANGLPAKVATSGIVNAYGAVLAIRNAFVGTDATRQGSWVGYYGSQGGYVVGDSSSFPTGFVTVTTSGGAPVVVDNSTKNPAALQRATDPSDRLSAYQGSATSETIDLVFNDGAVHRTRLYVVDPDHKKRTETISIVDANTGLTVDTRVVSNFTKGEYLTWDLRGSVNIVITSQSGGPAYSGLFFDAPDVTPDTFYNLDANTFGTNWRNSYGSQGDQIFGDDNTDQLPAYVSLFNVVGGALDVLHPTTRDRRGLQRNADLTHNIEAYQAAATSEDINVGFSDTLLHTVSLYLADYDNQHRSERVQVIDPTTGAVLVTQDVTSFKNGLFVSFNVTGAVTFRVINTGGPTAVVSGVFFDAPFGENGHSDGTDVSTGGNWRTSGYGTTAAFVVGNNFPGLDAGADARISISGEKEQVVRSPSGDNAALLTPTSTASSGKARVAAYAFSTTSMTLNYDPSDTLQHQLSLYFADFENLKRTESVTVVDATTKTVLSKQVVSSFRQGKYLRFDVDAPVQVIIQNMAGSPNAVLSGVFID